MAMFWQKQGDPVGGDPCVTQNVKNFVVPGYLAFFDLLIIHPWAEWQSSRGGPDGEKIPSPRTTLISPMNSEVREEKSNMDPQKNPRKKTEKTQILPKSKSAKKRKKKTQCLCFSPPAKVTI